MAWDDDQLTYDAFLGGRVHAWQPRAGYRAATDPVLLAAATEATPGQSVLELGCGAGVALLCLATRVPGLSLAGVERQEDYADLARRNLGAQAGIETADLADLPASMRQQTYHHVIANPPYYPLGGGTAASDPGREAALRTETPLETWVDVAARRLAPRGWLTMIQLAERLPEIMAALHPRLGSIALRPISGRDGRPAGRVLIRARKGGRSPFVLLPPLVMHEGLSHTDDGDSYAPRASAILRDGAALPWDA